MSYPRTKSFMHELDTCIVGIMKILILLAMAWDNCQGTQVTKPKPNHQIKSPKLSLHYHQHINQTTNTQIFPHIDQTTKPHAGNPPTPNHHTPRRRPTIIQWSNNHQHQQITTHPQQTTDLNRNKNPTTQQTNHYPTPKKVTWEPLMPSIWVEREPLIVLWD